MASLARLRIHALGLLIATLCLVALAPIARADVSIDWWQFWTDPGIKPTIDSMVAEFEAANPDIDVTVTDLTWANGHEKIAIAYASGTAPDVIELGSDWIAQFADGGHLRDISSQVQADSSEYSGWSMATYKGSVYGRPWILGTRILFINRDLLTQAGIPENWLPLQMLDLKNAVAAIDQLGDNIYGWGSNTAEKHRLYKKFLPFLWSLEGHILSPDNQYSVIASDQAIEALEYYKELHDLSGYVSNQRGIEDAFLAGRVGVVLSGEWLLKRIETENRRINYVTTLMPGPTRPGRVFPGKSFMGGEFLCVSKTSEHPEAAAKLIAFITSPENQLRFCRANRSANPSSKVAQKDEYFQSSIALQTFIAQLRLSSHPPVVPQWVEIETEIERAVEAVIFDNADATNTLYETGKKIQDLLRE